MMKIHSRFTSVRFTHIESFKPGLNLVFKFYRKVMNQFNAQDSTDSSLIEGVHCCCIHTAAASTLLPHTHGCDIHTAATVTLLPHWHCWRNHTSFFLLFTCCRSCIIKSQKMSEKGKLIEPWDKASTPTWQMLCQLQHITCDSSSYQRLCVKMTLNE